MHFASLRITWTALGLLLMAACSGDAASPEPDFMEMGKAADAGKERAVDAGHVSVPDAGSPQDAAVTGCPQREPTSGTACSGELRCMLQRHQDCLAPSCPAGCKYLGIKPGAMLTYGVFYFAVCQDGVWTQTSQGNCALNQSAAMCECAGQDAGTP